MYYLACYRLAVFTSIVEKGYCDSKPKNLCHINQIKI